MADKGLEEINEGLFCNHFARALARLRAFEDAQREHNIEKSELTCTLHSSNRV